MLLPLTTIIDHDYVDADGAVAAVLNASKSWLLMCNVKSLPVMSMLLTFQLEHTRNGSDLPNNKKKLNPA